SRTGKTLAPRLGMLAWDVEAFLQSGRRDLFFVPIAITYERLVEEGLSPKSAINWFQTEVLRHLNEERIDIVDFPLAPAGMAVVVRAVEEERVSVASGREALREAMASGKDPAALLADLGEQVSDAGALEAWIDEVLREHAGIAEEVREGKEKALPFLIGQVMRLSKGKANPRKVDRILRARLSVNDR
ncbi:MAG: hypothetical protein ACE5GW_07840, partial [Planctomycetota bacterium]